MQILGLAAIYPGPRTSIPHPGHTVFPYLLRGITASHPNHIWGTDITYIRLAHGFVYLTVFLDWYSRFILGWALSPIMETAFCLEALEASVQFGLPEIANSDQGSQFTSEDYRTALTRREIRISMDGRGRCMDNIFTERLWRTIKYEDIYIKAYETIEEARAGLSEYIHFYNYERPHQSLGYQTPAGIYLPQTHIII